MESNVQIPTHYTWEVENKSVSVLLDYDLIDKLSMEIMRGFSLVPKRGAEVGGILLGTVEIGEKVVIRVEDYEAVSCDYLRGPSYLLSPAEEARFAETIERYESASERRLYVVGLFRSHTRDNELSLADEDVALFRNYAKDPANIFLLVRPYATKASIGALFLEEDGELQRGPSWKEFPFRRRDLGGIPNIKSAAEPEASIAERQSAKDAVDLREWSERVQRITQREPGPTALPAEDSPSQRFRRKWILVPLSFVFLLVGVIAGFQAALVLNRADTDDLAYRSLGFAMGATRDGNAIFLRWDPNAAAIRFGRRAALTIEDGDFKRTVQLDAVQLQNGAATYRSANAGVVFRLEVETQRGSKVTESVQYQPAK
ncbi:MAG: hypothetical protein NW208_16875 [Bryobacter sp.]|nr:hypothetical protein [Bryobacter sp.]